MSNEAIRQDANQVASGDLIKLFSAIKQNVMRSLAVARVATVETSESLYSGTATRYRLADVSEPSVKYYAFAAEIITLKNGDPVVYKPQKGDLVLVVFSDTDYRTAYRSKITGSSAFEQNTLGSGDLHSKSYGIIIAKML